MNKADFYFPGNTLQPYLETLSSRLPEPPSYDSTNKLSTISVPWRNVNARNVLVMFWHPRNVHPMRRPSVHYVHCDISSQDETS
jgi:hypothetical protein